MGILFLWVHGIGCFILLWHSLGFPYSYNVVVDVYKTHIYTALLYEQAFTATHTVLVKIKTHFSFFSMISCKISWRNPGGISPAYLSQGCNLLRLRTNNLPECAFGLITFLSYFPLWT